MEITLNIWSLIYLICNIILFFIVGSSATFISFFIAHLHFHPLNAILLLTIGCFFLALIGMKDIKNRTTLIISYITITITLVFIAMIAFILIMGHLFS
jgi:hypothetical protein